MKVLNLINLCFIWVKTYPALLNAWRKKTFISPPPRLNYGYEEIPDKKQITFGGLVKLHDLSKAFPQCASGPNILYLISSALPYFPVRMARIARKVGAKVVINQNGAAYPGWYGKGWKSANKSIKKLLHMSDHVIYQSSFCKISAEKFLGARENKKFDILHNPVDTSVFSPISDKLRPGKKKVLLLSGSHWSQYRVIAALETLEKVRRNNSNVYLKIAGRFCWHNDESLCCREVQDYAKKLRLTDYLELSGPYSQLQAPNLMRQCSILLHTKYNDPCPRLVVEAMACGLPVVYSATGGVPELVGDEAGIGIYGPLDWEKDHPPGAEELASAVNSVLDDWDRFSKGARSRAVQKFDVEPWLKRHLEIFNQVLQ